MTNQIHLSILLSFCRTIWVQVVSHGRNPTIVEVKHDAMIVHVIDKALDKELLTGTVAPGTVEVRFGDEVVRPDTKVSKYQTTYDNPLQLICPQNEGMLIIVYSRC